MVDFFFLDLFSIVSIFYYNNKHLSYDTESNSNNCSLWCTLANQNRIQSMADRLHDNFVYPTELRWAHSIQREYCIKQPNQRRPNSVQNLLND